MKHSRYYLRLARKYGPWVITVLRIVYLVSELLSGAASYGGRRA